jgi:hypothetical protein
LRRFLTWIDHNGRWGLAAASDKSNEEDALNATSETDDGIYWGDWHRIGSASYACVAVPAPFPASLLAWLDPDSGLAGTLLLGLLTLVLLRRQKNRWEGPWAAVVLQQRRLRTPTAFTRTELPDRSSAMEHAAHVDAELKRGHLPESP